MNTFENTINELFELQRFSIKMGLDNITALCNHLDNPHKKFASLHVAGTNGKGATSAIVQRLLSNHGFKCGLYTSPHLIDFRERIRINEEYVGKDFLINCWENISKEVNRRQATFFDSTTAIAFEYFSRNNVDLAVIETGLGGRLDSTNILHADAAVITPIHYDHMKQLGDNLSSIAAEKAAIIKSGCTVFVSNQEPDVLKVINKQIRKNNTVYFLSDMISLQNIRLTRTMSQFDLYDKYRDSTLSELDLNLAGEFQIQNAALAYLASRWFIEKKGCKFSYEIFRDTLRTIEWPGRLQCIQTEPFVYLDVSHNYSGIRSTLDFLVNQFDKSKLYLLFGMLSDKAFDEIVKIIYPNFKKIVITEPLNERKLEGDRLAKEFARYKINVTIIKDIRSAFEFCLKKLKSSDTLVVMGSHFLIGPLMTYLHKKHLTSD